MFVSIPRNETQIEMNCNSVDFEDDFEDKEFRLLSLCPTFTEITDNKDLLVESNVINGKYKDVEHYLDTQYRLLREDFVRPLRRAINEYKRNIKCGKRWHKIQDIMVYENVRIEATFWATFDTKHLKHIDWRNSDRLITGSLVCLSFDDFQTFRFASICGQRFEHNLIKGIFKLEIETQLLSTESDFMDVLLDTSLAQDLYFKPHVMIEPKAYFEAYRYVLSTLQKFSSNNFPLQRYIIDVNTDVLRPSYITSETVFDFSHLIVCSEDNNRSSNEVLVKDSKHLNERLEYKKVKLMDSTQWPNGRELGFDDSQYEAFKSALLKQLVLIQGPPGTGKTYIGLKIVETLYMNRMYYKSKPILIVCYTNHALDQFLEGMLPFCDNLIRIGGQSKSELLKDYILRTKHYWREISSKQIIGMTTTGAAKYRHIIEWVDPKIVVIEEAAEVLESHVITSLTRSTEHLILIGDHKQLRPKTTDYELTKEHNLDISLFERMINNGMPFSQLKLQHRMRPEISGLLKPHIYELLFDDKSVFEYEDIKGLQKNMYFLNHSKNESSDENRMSKSNQFEAEFIVRLCKHLLYQDIESSKITILTLYSSQFFQIRDLLRYDDMCSEVKCEVLDSFQGEENDIILISFVRSNVNNDIGFLKISNRINVALSRAKKGLYCVGNFDCLSERSDLWTNICNYLNRIKAVGPALELKCTNHRNKEILVSEVRDFRLYAPFGGCCEPCVESLECGHNCPLKVCHPLSHQKLKCKENCFKLNCNLNHICVRLCHFPDACKPCEEQIEKTVPNCGHRIVEICSGNMFCTNRCERRLQCGHICLNKCGEECQVFCGQTIERRNEKCGHKMTVECYKLELISSDECQQWLCQMSCDGL